MSLPVALTISLAQKIDRKKTEGDKEGRGCALKKLFGRATRKLTLKAA